MNPNETYNPAEDENQGVMTKMVQGDQANAGTPQHGGIDLVKASGPESEKAEVNDSDNNSTGTNDDLLAEEDVEAGDTAESNEQ